MMLGACYTSSKTGRFQLQVELAKHLINTGFFNAILIIFISNLFLTKINGMLPHLRGP